MWVYLITVLLWVGVKEAVQPDISNVPKGGMNRGQRRSRATKGHGQVHSWNITRLPWWYHVIRVMCILCLMTRGHTTPLQSEGWW